MAKSQKKLVGTWLSEDVKNLLEKLAEARGISLSEYLRSLILSDLDKRAFTPPMNRERAVS